MTTRIEILAELERAERARAEGNEGRARVCARRAAGWAIGLTYRHHLDCDSRDALKLLEALRDHSGGDEALRAAARRLTVRVTPEYELPHDKDPIEDARRIVGSMLAPD